MYKLLKNITIISLDYMVTLINTANTSCHIEL